MKQKNVTYTNFRNTTILFKQNQKMEEDSIQYLYEVTKNTTGYLRRHLSKYPSIMFQAINQADVNYGTII